MRKTCKNSGWRDKLDPLFLKIATGHKERLEALKALGPDQPAALYAEIDHRFEQQMGQLEEEMDSKYGPDAITPSIVYYGCQNEAEMNFAYLCYIRTFKPLWKLAQEEWDGSLEARKQLVQLTQEWKDRCGGRPVKPPKIKLEHWNLFEFGLPLGLDTLTADELADCFEEFCSCGKDHSPDALKKLRARIKRERKRLEGLKQTDSQFARNFLSHHDHTNDSAPCWICALLRANPGR